MSFEVTSWGGHTGFVSGRFLVRNREIATSESERMQCSKGGCQALRLYGERNICSGEIVLFEPIIVQQRRAGVHHGPPHNARKQKTIGM